MVEIGKSKNLPIAQNNFQSRRQSPISNVQKLSNLKGTQPDQPIMSTVESFKIKFHLCKTAGLVDNWSIS